ncbi:MAG: hypothetical protein ABI844_08890 [Saprospiraceae bacterium]
MKILLFAVTLLMISCTKSSSNEVPTIQARGCSSTTKAVVKRKMLNVAGTDFFYYLEVTNSISNSNEVYPSFISTEFQLEGQKLDIQYTATDKKYSFIPCTAAHPTGLIEEYMPFIDLCKATAVY